MTFEDLVNTAPDSSAEAYESASRKISLQVWNAMESGSNPKFVPESAEFPAVELFDGSPQQLGDGSSVPGFITPDGRTGNFVFRDDQLCESQLSDGSFWRLERGRWVYHSADGKVSSEADGSLPLLTDGGKSLRHVRGSITRSQLIELVSSGEGEELVRVTTVDGSSTSSDGTRTSKIRYDTGRESIVVRQDEQVVEFVTQDGDRWLKGENGLFYHSKTGQIVARDLSVNKDGSVVFIDADGYETTISRNGQIQKSGDMADSPGPTLDEDDVSKVSLEIFSRVDTNNDGFLSREELGVAVQDRAFKSTDAQALAVLYAGQDTIKNLSTGEDGVLFSGGVSRADLAVLRIDDTADSIQLYTAALDVSGVQRGLVNKNLFKDAENPVESINADSVKQNRIGDCVFLATVAGMATREPDVIARMIKDNGDGTYTVTFPGAPDEPVTVNRPSDVELGLYAQASENGIWVNVLEKAYGAWSQKHFYRRSSLNVFDKGATPTEGADNGTLLERTAYLVTGRDGDRTPTSSAQTRHLLQEALKPGSTKSVTAGTNSADSSGRFHGNHRYTVMRFDSEHDLIVLRNPHGGDDAYTEVTMEEFLKSFRAIHIH